MSPWPDRFLQWLNGRAVLHKRALPEHAGAVLEPATRPVYLHLGLDFGTRFTKACVRNVGLERSSVVAFGSTARAVEDTVAKALLVSAVLVRDGRVYAGLTPAEWEDLSPGARQGDRVIEYLKMRLAGLDDPALVAPGWPPRGVGVQEYASDLEALALFYLSRVLKRSYDCIRQSQPEWFLNRSPRWSTSLGIPAAYTRSAIANRFKGLIRRAEVWAGNDIPAEIRLEDLREAARTLPAGNSTSEGDVCPEIAAAVETFVRARTAPEGVYLYFDVGAGTFDGNSFRLYRPPGKRRQVNIYSTFVAPLGVATLADVAARTLNLPFSCTLALLASSDPPGQDVSDVLENQREQTRQLVAKVILAGKRKEPDRWREELYDVARWYARRSTGLEFIPAFVGGGGGRSWLYRYDIIEATYKRHRFQSVNVLPWHVVELPVPEDLDFLGLPTTIFQRFAVAYGLSFPPSERSERAEPDEINDLEPPRRKPPHIRYEDSKDILQ